ncbi:MAG: hypothetical protein F6K53_20240 [Moorea sp. SIO4A1]|uniref:hypothetical protein n=1 Tax=Moorena sp. SIO4A1 TaxID=2607835 RepID=UPI001417BAB7|nr:hypothetical protein [Moorena sp. SIO4A1]NEO43269.1 hypothetical protein [Moorena sp. SIO4A3]NEQ59602.1 hypothetical protein [Moorena sp. SIO4A1]
MTESKNVPLESSGKRYIDEGGNIRFRISNPKLEKMEKLTEEEIGELFNSAITSIVAKAVEQFKNDIP